MSLKLESDNSISTGIDELNRRIFFGSYLPNAEPWSSNDFTQVSVEYAIRAIHKMAGESKKPIEIHMNSYGGDPYSMMYLYDVIESCPVQVKFFGGGAIMSAATWVMAVCDERYLYSHATIMVHRGWYSVEGQAIDNDIYSEEDKRLSSLLEEIYAKNSRMPKSFWSDVCKRDLYLEAQEAVMLGLADKVIEPKKRGNFRKMRAQMLSMHPENSKLQKTIKKLYNRIYMSNDKSIQITLNVSKDEIDESLIVDNTPNNKENKENDSGTRSNDSGNPGNSSPSYGTGGGSTKKS